MGTGTPAVEPQEADELTAALEGSKKGDEVKTEEEIKADAEAAKAAKVEEGKTDEEKAAEAAEAERQKPQEIEENGVTRMETAEEVTARIATEDAAAAEPTEMDLLKNEVKDLRQLLRTSKREQVQVQAELKRLGKRPAAAGEGEEELDEDGKPIKKEEEPLSRLEELQQGIANIGTERGASLDVLLETMEQNPKYGNVKEVCSRANFDDIFESIATQMVEEKGGDINEALLEVEFNVWNRANPYSYMYGLITKYHPTYVKKEEATPGDDKGKKKEPAKAPGSIANLGGDSDIKSGWTKARIDDLPEDQLDTVPKDIYDKYMRGELD
jgi:hypothetical protein